MMVTRWPPGPGPPGAAGASSCQMTQRNLWQRRAAGRAASPRRALSLSLSSAKSTPEVARFLSELDEGPCGGQGAWDPSREDSCFNKL